MPESNDVDQNGAQASEVDANNLSTSPDRREPNTQPTGADIVAALANSPSHATWTIGSDQLRSSCERQRPHRIDRLGVARGKKRRSDSRNVFSVRPSPKDIQSSTARRDLAADPLDRLRP